MAIAFDKNVGRYWWSIHGRRVYDQLGTSICNIWVAQMGTGGSENNSGLTMHFPRIGPFATNDCF